MKDRAYLAAGKIIQNNLKMKGAAKDKFLTRNFKKVWDSHDKQQKNTISQDEAKSFFEELL